MQKKCCCNKKERDDKEKKLLTNRLSRIEGQIRGIKTMVDSDAYCIDIVTQVSAVSAAINAFNKELLEKHIKSCVVNDIKDGNNEKINELCDMLKKLMK